MKELELIIRNHTGLHARPAKVLSKLAKKYGSKISIQYDGKEANAKSMISLLKLGVKQSAEISFLIEGDDEVDAAQAISEAVNSGLGESIDPIEPATKSEEAAPETTDATVSKPVTGSTNQASNATQKDANEGVADKPESSPIDEVTGISGQAASSGIAIGSIFHKTESDIVLPTSFDGAEKELAKLKDSISKASSAVKALHQKMIDEGLEDEAAIFEAHGEILDDPGLLSGAESSIKNGQNCARAWQQQIESEAQTLASLDDPILSARSADVRDVGDRVLRLITGQEAVTELPKEPYILAAVDLAPSDTANLDRDMVLGIATMEGGPTAHSAIIARALGLPAIVGIGHDLKKISNGQVIIMNGDTGVINDSPSEDDISQAKSQQDEARKAAEDAASKANLEAKTSDGHFVEIAANAGSVSEVKEAYELGADAIGLFRTEFLFLGREDAPSEEEQTKTYGEIAAAMQSRPVIFRTLDIGGDKPVPYITVASEENPFLGERGIRLQLNRPELMRSQLRALLKASASGSVRIMFPMIGRVDEWRAARKIVTEICEELKIDEVEIGMMIEVPSAALMAHAFAPEVDFFSVGTNDLTQYTLAIDRQHPTLTAHADGLDPAVLLLIQRTVDAAKAHGKWVGVCGELGADPQATPILIGLGVHELSVNIRSVARLKARVRELSLKECQALAKKALACSTAQDVRQLFA